MKLMLILMITLEARAVGYAQNITFSRKNATLEQVFWEITKQSGYEFVCDVEMLKETKPLNVHFLNVPLKEVLKKCFENQPLTYVIANNTVIVKRHPKEIEATYLNQQQAITGTVVDTTGLTLPGASVIIKGTKVGTQTDNSGRFFFPPLDQNAILVVSYTGYITQEIPAKGRSQIKVVLKEDGNKLSEVVVVAFGTQKKTDMVGSVTSVSPEDLRIPSSNLTTALAGQAAGIIAYQRSGEPGQDNADFFIRGVTSFGTGKVDPLILIDGVELSVTELARLRPDDIQSFSIMKDATSTALYGARGANGVIHVTTKTGKAGTARISLRAESSLSTPTSNVELADPVSFMRLYNEAQISRDPFAVNEYAEEKIDATEAGLNPVIFPAVDWRKALFKENTLNHRYNLNVSGGGKVARYYVAGSFAQDNGVLKVDKINNFNNNIDLKSYTLRANVNIDLTKSTELIVRLNGNFDDYVGPIDGGGKLYQKVIATNPVNFQPYYPIDDEHSYVQHIMFGGTSTRAFLNPYADMVKGYKEYTRSLMLAQMELKQDFSFLVKGLTFNTMFNTNRISRFDIVRAYKPFYYELSSSDYRTGDYSVNVINEESGEEFLSFGVDENLRQQSTVFYSQSQLDYNRKFNKHHISGLLVYMMGSSANAKAGNLQLSLPTRNLGLSGRATYAYDSRYFAEFNFGYNGSERFHETNRFGFFPSAGLAWSISNEKFWAPLKDKINNFRLRATYGLVGNEAIGSPTDRFFYLSNVNMNASIRKYTFGKDVRYASNGINISRYANNDITWETSHKTNLAVELGLFNKLNIQADFFSEVRKNILMTRADVPSTMGLTSGVRANLGEATGRGMDVSLDYSQSFSNRIWLQARGNFTYAKSKFSVYEEPVYINEWWKSRVGQPISQQWGYIAERLFVDDNEVQNSPPQNFGQPNIAGDIKYKDVNGDGQITSLDQVPLGFPSMPEITYGAGLSFGWGSFDISSFFQGSAQSSFWVDPSAVQPFVGGKQIMKAFADNHFSLDNSDTYALWPRLSIQHSGNNTQRSTWWLHNGNFLRLKQVELGYTLPQKHSQKMHMRNLRVYVSGSNLWALSNFKLWDVEMGDEGLGYPLQKVFNLGVSVTF